MSRWRSICRYPLAKTLLTLTHSFPSGYDPRPYLAGWHEFMDAIEDGRFVWDTPERKVRTAHRETICHAIAAADGQVAREGHTTS